MSEIISTAKESDEIIERLEYMAVVLDTPSYNTADEVTAIREAIKLINEHDNLVARAEKAETEVERLRDELGNSNKFLYEQTEAIEGLQYILTEAKAKLEKAEAEAERLRHKNESYKQVLCARTVCVKNCNECEYEAEAKRDE